MSNSDRGAYTPPTDSPLSFDARQPVRGGGPNSSTLMISAVILVVLIAGAGFWLYKDGGRGANDEPQPVGAAVAEAKAPPPEQAQPEDANTSLQIYKHDDLAETDPTFTPGPEPVQARPVTPVAAAELRPAQPAAQPTPSHTVTGPPKPVTVAVAAKPAVAPVVPAKTTGTSIVQIGAFSSEALADRGWSDAAAVSPGLAAGKGKRVEPIDKDGKTLYRTSVTGFASRADALTFCDSLKGAGKSCFVR
ncbi:MAG: SPOR domain-containing protein [Caulobacter sp.]|nr:SPOR domain-containing protein [Caulobacter sp.]